MYLFLYLSTSEVTQLFFGFGFGCKAAFIEGKSVPLFRDSAPAKEVIEKGTSLPGFTDLLQTYQFIITSSITSSSSIALFSIPVMGMASDNFFLHMLL